MTFEKGIFYNISIKGNTKSRFGGRGTGSTPFYYRDSSPTPDTTEQFLIERIEGTNHYHIMVEDTGGNYPIGRNSPLEITAGGRVVTVGNHTHPNNRIWRIEEDDEGYFKIFHVRTERYIDWGKKEVAETVKGKNKKVPQMGVSGYILKGIETFSICVSPVQIETPFNRLPPEQLLYFDAALGKAMGGVGAWQLTTGASSTKNFCWGVGGGIDLGLTVNWGTLKVSSKWYGSGKKCMFEMNMIGLFVSYVNINLFDTSGNWVGTFHSGGVGIGGGVSTGMAEFSDIKVGKPKKIA